MFNLINAINNLEAEYCQEKVPIIQNYQLFIFIIWFKKNFKKKKENKYILKNYIHKLEKKILVFFRKRSRRNFHRK